MNYYNHWLSMDRSQSIWAGRSVEI